MCIHLNLYFKKYFSFFENKFFFIKVINLEFWKLRTVKNRSPNKRTLEFDIIILLRNFFK